jgi:hypothetical protein
MELSLRLDTLGLVEMHYLRGRERYRDWPAFQLEAASRQARILAYMTREVVEQLHQQILAVESAVGLDIEFEDDMHDQAEEENNEESEGVSSEHTTERDSSTSAFSPSLAQALDRLNELARQRLPEAGPATSAVERSELLADSNELTPEEEGALEQLQDAFVQMMDVVRDLAEELATDALKLTGRFRCARTNIVFTQADSDDEEEEDEGGSESEDEEDEGQEMPLHSEELGDEEVVELEVELVMVLQLFEEGRARSDDSPAVELQLDVDDFERLHETLDLALQREERSRRRPSHIPSERSRRNRRRR